MPDKSKPEWFDALLFDGNGITRTFRAPKSQMDAMLRDGINFPFSVFAMRYDGVVVEETGAGLQQGDPDGKCMPIERTLSPTPFRKGGMQAVFTMCDGDGNPHYADPRAILAKAAARFSGIGYHKPVAAAELEFYLQPAAISNQHQWANNNGEMPQLYSAEPLAENGAFVDMLAESMAAANIPGGAVISEYGGGQMEVNLHHRDADNAALDGLMLRYLARRCAEAHNMRATFLAKPRADSSGSGMHFHLSFANAESGCYLFADSGKLRNAIAGVLSLMNEGMAFFAPFANSYRRFIPGGYAPTTASWGPENRAAAVRVPMAKADNEKRIEFRLPGADANPYLVLAVLLSAAHYGMQNKIPPPQPQKGNNPTTNKAAPPKSAKPPAKAKSPKPANAKPPTPASAKPPIPANAKLPMTWRAALDSLAEAKVLPDYMGERYIAHYLTLKESEWQHHRNHISDYDRQNYAAVI